ncbi:hypothetical protein [Pseudoxanthomonas wuyuanensis]
MNAATDVATTYTLTETELGTLVANYGDSSRSRWHKAERIDACISLVIDHQPVPLVESIPPPLREWSRARVHRDHPQLGGMRLRVPQRLHALLSPAVDYRIDGLVSGGEVWLLAFEAIDSPAVGHDLLAEWSALSGLPHARSVSPHEEWLYDPTCEHREKNHYALWMVLAVSISGFGLIFSSRAGMSPLGILPLLVGLLILLHLLRRDIFPGASHGVLLAVDQPLRRIGPVVEWPIAWYRCGELLIEQQHRQPSAGEGRNTLVYVDATPGHLKIRLTRVDGQPAAWRSQDVFRLWLAAKLDWMLVAIPMGYLVMLGIFHGAVMAGVNPLRPHWFGHSASGPIVFDPWIFAYSLTAAVVLLVCWRFWRKTAMARMEALYGQS